MKRPKRRKHKKNLGLTTDSREYKMVKRQLDLGCPICPPNKGCNRNRDNDNRSWKNYRNNQWKE